MMVREAGGFFARSRPDTSSHLQMPDEPKEGWQAVTIFSVGSYRWVKCAGSNVRYHHHLKASLEL